MTKKRGNPSWYKGMPSANPEGRPKGKTSLEAYKSDEYKIRPPFYRWERFCWALTEPPYTGAAAARKAGYSYSSARFIASRLKRNIVTNYILKKHRAMVELYGITGNIEYSRTGDVIGKLEALKQYR